MRLALVVSLFFVALTSCKTVPRKSSPTSPGPTRFEEPQEGPEPVISQQIDTKPEKFGLLFSGGGVRTWSYITILKEMQKYKMPIVAAAGVEWGAIVAGVFAQNVSANEVEWELSKFKRADEWLDYIKKSLEKKSIAKAKIPFACASLNLRNQTSYILNKGQLDALIPLCLPALGVIKPHSQSVASMGDMTSLVQFLKNTGATKIILINAISPRSGKPHGSGLESAENQLWIQSASALNKKAAGVDEIIEIDLANIPVERFDLRRSVMNASVPLAKDQLKRIANKYGF